MTNAEKYLKPDMKVAMWKDYNETGQKCKSVWQWLDQEAKPALTEDERVILKFLENFDYIGRDKEGLYYKLQDENNKEKTAVIYNLTTNLFQFIKEGEEYEIAELLGGE